MIPNSTSQSNFLEFGTISILSLGPLIQLVAFINIIGSDGTGKPDSAAWSEKFRPIPINLPGFVIHEPILSLKDSSGSEEKSALCNLEIVSKFK